MNSCLLSLVSASLKVKIVLVGGVVGGVAYPISGFNAGVSKNMVFFYGLYISLH